MVYKGRNTTVRYNNRRIDNISQTKNNNMIHTRQQATIIGHLQPRTEPKRYSTTVSANITDKTVRELSAYREAKSQPVVIIKSQGNKKRGVLVYSGDKAKRMKKCVEETMKENVTMHMSTAKSICSVCCGETIQYQKIQIDADTRVTVYDIDSARKYYIMAFLNKIANQLSKKKVI